MPLPSTARRPALIAGVLALALGTTALTALPSTAETERSAGTPAIPRSGPEFADVVDRVAPSVVRVLTPARVSPASAELPPGPRGRGLEEFFRGFGGGAPGAQPPARTGQGSGFIVDASGVIVTNAHVVGAATEVQVGLADGRTLPARVLGRDVATDIAVLKIEAGQPLAALRFGDSDRTRIGEWVMAMGSPFGLGSSVTAGIVSARGRQIGAGPYDDFIQTDAPINPGNSGGPLFNAAGEVIGVNTAIFSPSGGNVGIGFAVPSRMAQSIVAQLREHGTVRRGWLGVSMQPMDADMAAALGAAAATGVLVNSVEPNSPAATAGLRAGDVITALGDRRVATPRDLAAGVAETPAGQSVTLAVVRGGAATTLNVEIGTSPANRAQAANQGQPASPSLGLSLAPRPSGGAAIARVEPGSVAAERGLMPGDAVLRVGDREVRGPQDVADAVTAARAAGRPAVALQIEREGRSRFVAIPLRAA
jgi:serine protease Do